MIWSHTAQSLAFGCAVLVAGCAPSSTLCRPDPITGSQQCQSTTSSPAAAVVTTGAAAAVYSVTGCDVNGCQLPDECNPVTKRCQTIRCNESKPCPAGYNCDRSTMLCR